jgi:eukaryotic-like serine/threonine-protein kinase
MLAPMSERDTDTVLDGGKTGDTDRTEYAPLSAPPRSVRPEVSRGLSRDTAESTLILRNEEAQRTRVLLWLVLPLVSLSIVSLFIPAHVNGRLPCAIVFGTTLVFDAALLWHFRDPSRFDVRWLAAYGAVCVAAILAATVVVGIYSPVIMAACLGIYFFGQSDTGWVGWWIYALSAVGYAALNVAAILGVVPLSDALLSVSTTDPVSLGVLSVMLQVMLALTFGIARWSRRATRVAFERLDRASRQIRQREALLNEARADLDRAQAAKLGRYSGRQIGRFLVDEVIGRGGMGEVYQARDLERDQPAALKFLHVLALDEPGAVERFSREAEVARTLESPHVVRMFGVGHADDGAPYIAMELLTGSDLADHLRDRKNLPLKDVTELVSQVGLALTAADEAGIVHRDLKPQNVFRAEEGRKRVWKVLDFGVSKLKQSSATLTQGAAIGTPSYMAPEQAKGLSVDHRADVFSLAVIAYRSLTGRPAFTGPDAATTLYNVVYAQPVRPSELVKLPPDVERVLALALAKDPARRLSSAALFAAAFKDAASDRLDDRLRRDADALIVEAPWGIDLGARR